MLEVRGLISGLVKSDTMLPTARSHYDVSSEFEVVLPDYPSQSGTVRCIVASFTKIQTLSFSSIISCNC